MNRKTTVQGTDGNNYEITKDMVQIFMKTEKTSSKYFNLLKTQIPLIPLYWKVQEYKVLYSIFPTS